MRRLRRFVKIPTATNTVVVNFEQLAACIQTDAIDVILLDTTFWGGLRQAWMAGLVCQSLEGRGATAEFVAISGWMSEALSPPEQRGAVRPK